MPKKLRVIVTLALALIALTAYSAQDSRRQLPSFFYDSYIGLNAGFAKFNYTNDQITPGFSAGKIENKRCAARIFIGHYITPYLAVQISLMRPYCWVYYSLPIFPSNRLV